MNKILTLLSISALLINSCSNDNIERQIPNIIYILADDLGYAELGCYGQEKIKTPNIDALASNGIMFTDHYAGAPVCAPSRCVLLTGLHLGHAQIRGNDEWAERGNVWDFEAMSKDPNLEGQRPLKTGTVTIGTILKQAGYTTGIVGKWGLGGPLTEGIPNKQGFDFFYGYNCQRQAHTYFPLHLWKNTEKVKLNNKLVPPQTKIPEGEDPYDEKSYSDFWLNDYSPELMQKEVIKFIKDNKDRPFFMYYANPIPHAPLQAPKNLVDYYVKRFGYEEPYTGEKGYFPHRYPHACYAAMVSYFDQQVGEIVSTLKELNIDHNTLIIFTSDNGPTYNGGTDSPWFDSAKPFICEQGWGKGNLTEGGIRVPMIACWPARIKPGTESNHISAFYDVMPTICEITGIPKPDNTDGISFLPALTGNGKQEQHEFLYWEFPAYGGQQAVRIGKWKALRRNILTGNLTTELYDLTTDPQELNDLAGQYPEIIKKAETFFANEHTPAEIKKFKFSQLGD